MGEQLVSTRLPESDNESSLIKLDLRGDDFCWRLYDVAFLRLTNSEHIRSSPFVFETVPSKRNGLGAFLQFFRQPIREGLVEVLFCGARLYSGRGTGDFLRRKLGFPKRVALNTPRAGL